MNNYFDSVASEWDRCPDKVKRAKVTAEKVIALSLSPTESVIDFGCGTGLLGTQLSKAFGEVVLVDSSEKMLAVASSNLQKANIDNVRTKLSESLSDLSGEYSAIVTLMTLHHVSDVKSFFLEAFECLSFGGHLIIADLFQEDGSFHKHNPSFDGHNGFDTSFLTELAINSGFTVKGSEKYFDIWQENYDGELIAYPLFFFVASKLA